MHCAPFQNDTASASLFPELEPFPAAGFQPPRQAVPSSLAHTVHMLSTRTGFLRGTGGWSPWAPAQPESFQGQGREREQRLGSRG